MGATTDKVKLYPCGFGRLDKVPEDLVAQGHLAVQRHLPLLARLRQGFAPGDKQWLAYLAEKAYDGPKVHQ